MGISEAKAGAMLSWYWNAWTTSERIIERWQEHH
jgi:hypothetical protein